MNTSNNKRFQATEQRILDCALKLIGENPNRSLSVSAICEELSINRSSFYIHHKNIQSVLDAIMERYRAELMAQFRADGNALSAAVRRCFLFASEHQSFYRYYTTFSENPGLSSRYLLECFEYQASSISAGCELTDLQFSYLCEFMQAGLSAVINRWLNSGAEDSLDEIVELFTKILNPIDALKAPA
ncbi:MAG: TetR/AcrR family transcriptional regulator [Oscillospiraceae bacterium]|nr:TetR/AcrR family transcriptional regulator [Oscillospiraceae bacterium]